MNEEGRGWVGIGSDRKGGGGLELSPATCQPSRCVCMYVCTVEAAPPRCFGGNNEKRVTIEILLIIVQFILHSICVLNYSKVYVKHKIFDKNPNS